MKTLELINICKSFNDVDILQNISLTINRGESTCLFGASGSGKSSLLYIASGIIKQDLGEVLVMDKKMQTEEDFLNARRSYFGFIFQFHNLIPELSVSENIYINQKICNKEDKEFASFLLNELGLFDKKDMKPQTLSGGEAQRVAVIRAFASKPSIVFADEPTGSLDPQTGEKTMNLILDLAKQYSISLLTVSHNQNFKKKFDKNFEIKNKSLHLI
jgi:ABC-type lipoprotein export system ATPase subunit